MMTSKTLFISDLHLAENEQAITAAFLNLLQQADASVNAIYILGDLFEAWIGDDDLTPYHQQIISVLKQTTARGIRIYFMPGNRDFLIGKRFLSMTGCALLPDEIKITPYRGQSALLMHGDTLCTADHAYLRARKLAKNRFLQRLFLCLPLSFRKHLASKLRQESKNYTQQAPKEIMDVTQTAVEETMAKHHVNLLIHGHTHKPNTHHFTVNQEPKQRIVLGAWHDAVNMLIWDDADKITYTTLPVAG